MDNLRNIKCNEEETNFANHKCTRYVQTDVEFMLSLSLISIVVLGEYPSFRFFV